MTMSPEIGKLSEALSKAQGIMENAIKDKDNAFLKSNYSTLTSVWNACRHALSSNGLCVIQSPEFEGEQLVLTTILSHSSGEYIKSRLPIHTKDKSSQALGSAITYARRYALAAMVGISPDEDSPEEDDGNYSNEKYTHSGKRSPSFIGKDTVSVEDKFYQTFKDIPSNELQAFIKIRPDPMKTMKNALDDIPGFRAWYTEFKNKNSRPDEYIT